MALAFLEDGWKVYATLRRASERQGEFRNEFVRFPGKIALLECDITSRSDRASVRGAVERDLNGLDCLVNNAGMLALGSLEDTSEDELRQQIETNFFGAALLTQELLPLLRARRGTIINVSSIFGFVTWPLTSIYCASKFALEGWTQSLRQELGPVGVRVALLEPGSNPTALNDNLRWGTRVPVDGSPYGLETAGYQAFRKSLAKRKQRKMSRVARLAVRLADSSNPSLHNPAGVSTASIYFLARMLPQKVGVDLMNWFARRTFRNALKSSK
jgi:NAD(P)-dependent dehydrogenase (short-subunit alcohol dehydrogenase family)